MHLRLAGAYERTQLFCRVEDEGGGNNYCYECFLLHAYSSVTDYRTVPNWNYRQSKLVYKLSSWHLQPTYKRLDMTEHDQ